MIHFRAKLVVGLLLVLSMHNAQSEQNRDNNIAGGLSTSVRLNHRVVIPQIIYFRVGDPAFDSVDKVTIDLNDNAAFVNGKNTFSGDNPLGSGNSVTATDNPTLVVDLRSNVGSVQLSYQVDNPAGLSSGSGFIPFDEIDTASNNASLPAPELNNGAIGTETIVGNLFGGLVINRQAQWTYSYANTEVRIAGTYRGLVTYTASTL